MKWTLSHSILRALTLTAFCFAVPACIADSEPVDGDTGYETVDDLAASEDIGAEESPAMAQDSVAPASAELGCNAVQAEVQESATEWVPLATVLLPGKGTATGESAVGSGQSATCSGPCNDCAGTCILGWWKIPFSGQRHWSGNLCICEGWGNRLNCCF